MCADLHKLPNKCSCGVGRIDSRIDGLVGLVVPVDVASEDAEVPVLARTSCVVEHI